MMVDLIVSRGGDFQRFWLSSVFACWVSECGFEMETKFHVRARVELSFGKGTIVSPCASGWIKGGYRRTKARISLVSALGAGG